METTINVNLKVWRQRGPKEPGQFVKYRVENVSTGSSFLEMLDMLNQQIGRASCRERVYVLV